MNANQPRKTGGVLAATLAAGALLAASAQADMLRPVLSPGGINVQSNTIITSVATTTNGGVVDAQLTFKGLQAPYDVQVQAIGAPAPTWAHGAYTALKSGATQGSVTVSNAGANAMFRLCMLGLTNYAGRYVDYSDFSGISNVFVGYPTCNGCHGKKVEDWLGTRHAGAVDSLKDTNGVLSAFFNNSCVVCHSVGKGQPGGFTDITNTPSLAGVGCESCHGPANAHVNISGRQYHPAATLDPKLCGGCHTDSHHPTYDEYETTLHAEVNEDITGSFVPSASDATAYGRMMSCGPCHTAAARASMLSNVEARKSGVTNYLALPSRADASAWTAACVTCHDPHSKKHPAQLRYPLASTEYFSFFTGSVTATNYGTDVFGQPQTNILYRNEFFANEYNENIQVCGQCHNSRGARWDGKGMVWNGSNVVLGTTVSYSRPPHHSPQYNILSGIVQPDYLNMNVNIFGSHSQNEKGCALCHMETAPIVAATATNAEVPAITGHRFEVQYIGCTECHDSQNDVTTRVQAVQGDTTSRINSLVSALNNWSTAKGVAVFGAVNAAKYGVNGWEFSNKGSLSTATNAGPSSTDQVKIPELIRQARFNLYMVGYDQSLGVHNADYTRFLLMDASNKVWQASQ